MAQVDMKLLTPAAYARHRGVSRPAVAKALRERRITATAEGLIDPVAADVQWQTNTRPRAGYERRTAPPAAAAAAGQDADFISYAEAKRRTAIADMLVAAREAARQARQLCRVEEVKTLWAESLTVCRSRLLNIASRVAPQVPQPHVRLVFDAITAEVREALTDLSRTDGVPGEDEE